MAGVGQGRRWRLSISAKSGWGRGCARGGCCWCLSPLCCGCELWLLLPLRSVVFLSHPRVAVAMLFGLLSHACCVFFVRIHPHVCIPQLLLVPSFSALPCCFPPLQVCRPGRCPGCVGECLRRQLSRGGEGVRLADGKPGRGGDASPLSVSVVCWCSPSCVCSGATGGAVVRRWLWWFSFGCRLGLVGVCCCRWCCLSCRWLWAFGCWLPCLLCRFSGRCCC